MAKDPAGGKRGNKQIVASNRKARHNYSILELFEAGVALQGTEVKSLREGHASLADAFATVDDGEVWLRNMHIPEYQHGAGRTMSLVAIASCYCIADRSTP